MNKKIKVVHFLASDSFEVKFHKTGTKLKFTPPLDEDPKLYYCAIGLSDNTEILFSKRNDFNTIISETMEEKAVLSVSSLTGFDISIPVSPLPVPEPIIHEFIEPGLPRPVVPI